MKAPEEGKYRVRVKTGGYKEYTEEVSLKKGEEIQLAVGLERKERQSQTTRDTNKPKEWDIHVCNQDIKGTSTLRVPIITILIHPCTECSIRDSVGGVWDNIDTEFILRTNK